jgi:hypothetical protein
MFGRWRAVLATLFALAAGCRPSEPAAAPGPIVLIVVDTLRADHLSCYGYSRPTSPAMCALAEDGVLFERAYTTRTSTTPAIASMLTGLYPHRHGVKELYYVLPPAMTTVAERLRAHGWATGGFVSSFVMVRDFSGFDGGFDVYDDDVRTRERLRQNYERSAADTVEHAIIWLRAHAGADAPRAGSRVAEPVSVVDVFPTVLHAADIDAPAGPAAAVDLGSIAHGAIRPAPPVTELEGSGAVTLAVHGDACTVRWAVPSNAAVDAAVPTGWLALARQLRVDPPDRDASCVQATARHVSALVADRLSFRLDVPVVFREDMLDLSNRTRFIAARTQSSVPLAPRDLEALRQLGYAK